MGTSPVRSTAAASKQRTESNTDNVIGYAPVTLHTPEWAGMQG